MTTRTTVRRRTKTHHQPLFSINRTEKDVADVEDIDKANKNGTTNDDANDD
jgi:hypothetical protein